LKHRWPPPRCPSSTCPARRCTVWPLDFGHTDMLVADAYEAALTFLTSLHVDGPGLYASPAGKALPRGQLSRSADDCTRRLSKAARNFLPRVS